VDTWKRYCEHTGTTAARFPRLYLQRTYINFLSNEREGGASYEKSLTDHVAQLIPAARRRQPPVCDPYSTAMLSRSEASRRPARQTLPERSEWAQGDTYERQGILDNTLGEQQVCPSCHAESQRSISTPSTTELKRSER
jgi:hypothetical protein